uniref:Bm1320 n=1 Tax=Brugia malayi TaxID=6279 RepID=A0A0J9Y842_BRUMA|nr:Bm1320 [Brugia malayi]
MTHERHELNETREIERSRSGLRFLLYLFIIPLFIIIDSVIFSGQVCFASVFGSRWLC